MVLDTMGIHIVLRRHKREHRRTADTIAGMVEEGYQKGGIREHPNYEEQGEVTMADEKIIMYDSNEAAKVETGISGWVDSHGRFFGSDEHLARWSGCTHKLCECGELVKKDHIRCDLCREQADIDRYEAAEREEWDEQSPLYSQAHDRFFDSMDEIYDTWEESKLCLPALRLYICDAQYMHPGEADHWADVMPEEGDLPEEILKAIDDLNMAIKDYGSAISWFPSKCAADIKSIA